MLDPPPDPLHATSLATFTAPVVASVARLSVVPPTAITHGLYAGYPPGFPRSPVENTQTAFVSLQYESLAVSPLISPVVPQLLLMTETPLCFAAYAIAVLRSVKLLDFASTSRMFAAGASAWAHSTSSDASNAQLASVAGRSDVLPVWLTFLNEG